MSECLVTTLKDSCGDNSIRKLDEFIMEVYPSNEKARFVLDTSEVVTAVIEGNGYFTNEEGTANLGKTMEYTGGVQYGWLSRDNNSRYRVRVSPKSAIKEISVFMNAGTINFSNACGIDLSDIMGTKLKYMFFFGIHSTGDISVLKYVPTLETFRTAGKGFTGDLAVFEEMPNIKRIEIRRAGTNAEITGDLSSLSSKTLLQEVFLMSPTFTGNISSLKSLPVLTKTKLSDCPNITGNLSDINPATISFRVSNTQVTGNISSLVNAPDIDTFEAVNTSITGNLTSFRNCTKLETISIDGTEIEGDTSSLASLTNLTTFTYANCPNITGTWPLV